MKTLRSRLLAKDVLIGTFAAIPHPMTVEMTAGAGWDFLVIDAEHSQVDRGDFEPLLRAAQVAATPAVIRLPGLESIWINSALDSGAAGILLPRINSAAEAKAAIAAMRYPPAGERGVGPGRAAGYGTRIEQAIADSVNAILAVQIESAQGLAHIDEIAALDGIDAIYIGPGDLALSLGAMGPAGRPALERAIGTIVDSCKRHGRPVGTFCMTPDQLKTAIAQGMTFVTLGSDAVFLGKALKDAADAARKAGGK